MFKTLNKYLYISWLFFKSSLMAQLEYRFNFFLILSLGVLYVMTRAVFIAVVYNTNITVDGLIPDIVLLHIGVFTIISGVFGLLFSDNFFSISDYIRDGTMDHFITKPISSQFLVSFKNFNVALSFPDLLFGLIMFIVACNRLEIALSFTVIFGFALVILNSLFILYSLFFIPHILCFWITKGSSIIALSNSLFEFNVMPMNIYGRTIQMLGIFLIPIFIIPNFPTMFLLDKLSFYNYLWSLLAGFFLFWITRKFWKLGLKNYSSCGG